MLTYQKIKNRLRTLKNKVIFSSETLQIGEEKCKGGKYETHIKDIFAGSFMLGSSDPGSGDQ
jgi:hypothetical protein